MIGVTLFLSFSTSGLEEIQGTASLQRIENRITPQPWNPRTYGASYPTVESAIQSQPPETAIPTPLNVETQEAVKGEIEKGLNNNTQIIPILSPENTSLPSDVEQGEGIPYTPDPDTIKRKNPIPLTTPVEEINSTGFLNSEKRIEQPLQTPTQTPLPLENPIPPPPNPVEVTVGQTEQPLPIPPPPPSEGILGIITRLFNYKDMEEKTIHTSPKEDTKENIDLNKPTPQDEHTIKKPDIPPSPDKNAREQVITQERAIDIHKKNDEKTQDSESNTTPNFFRTLTNWMRGLLE